MVEAGDILRIAGTSITGTITKMSDGIITILSDDGKEFSYPYCAFVTTSLS